MAGSRFFDRKSEVQVADIAVTIATVLKRRELLVLTANKIIAKLDNRIIQSSEKSQKMSDLKKYFQTKISEILDKKDDFTLQRLKIAFNMNEQLIKNLSAKLATNIALPERELCMDKIKEAKDNIVKFTLTGSKKLHKIREANEVLFNMISDEAEKEGIVCTEIEKDKFQIDDLENSYVISPRNSK